MIQSIFKDLGFSNNSGKPNFAVSEFLNDSDTGKFADFWMNPIGIALERWPQNSAQIDCWLGGWDKTGCESAGTACRTWQECFHSNDNELHALRLGEEHVENSVEGG